RFSGSPSPRPAQDSRQQRAGSRMPGPAQSSVTMSRMFPMSSPFARCDPAVRIYDNPILSTTIAAVLDPVQCRAKLPAGGPQRVAHVAGRVAERSQMIRLTGNLPWLVGRPTHVVGRQVVP